MSEDNFSTFKSLDVPVFDEVDKQESARAGAMALDGSGVIITAVGTWTQHIIIRSADNGKTWTRPNATDADGNAVSTIDSYDFIAFDPRDNNIVYADWFKSADKGLTWKKLSKVVIGMSKDGAVIYAADDIGSYQNIYKSSDGGEAWAYHSKLNVSTLCELAVAVDKNSNERLYVAGSTAGIHVWDFDAKSWSKKTETDGFLKDYLGSYETWAIAVDHNKPNIIYAGRRNRLVDPNEGVYRSLDYGNTWEDISYNLGGDSISIQSVKVSPHDSYVYIGSFFGIWKLPPSYTSAPDTTIPQGSISINSGVSYTNSASVTLSLSATDSVGVNAYYLSTSSTTPSASDSGWIALTSTVSYSASASHILSSGDGSKTIYAWYKDAAGNVSSVSQASITLDATSPTIIISSPTTSSTYSTSSNTLSLSGTASDEASGSGLKEVTWSSSQGGSGTATLTDSTWSLSNITLVSGTNTITVTATDNAGNSSADSLTVTYTLPQTGTIAFSGASYSRSESYTSATITVTRTGGSDGAASIQYSTTDGSATSGQDYTSTSGSLNWVDGVSANRTFTIPIISDTIDEPNETVNLTLTNATGASLGTLASAALTINDNDNPPTVAFTSTSQSKAENQGTATITLQLSSESAREITLPFNLSGTATGEGTDYSITPSPLTIPVGQTSADISVTLTNDTTYESQDETVIITLGTPTNTTRGSPSSHTLTIADDDLEPDTTSPAGKLSINSGVSLTNTTAVSLSLSATDTIGVTAYYLSNYNLTPEATATGWTNIDSSTNYSSILSYTLSSGDGNKILYAWYKDAAGNVSSVSQVSITLDATSPTIIISSPTTSSTYSTSSNIFNLSGSASDIGSGLSAVTYTLNSGISSAATGTANWSIANLSLQAGANTITVTATDNAGNFSSDTLTVTYTISTPRNNRFIRFNLQYSRRLRNPNYYRLKDRRQRWSRQRPVRNC